MSQNVQVGVGTLILRNNRILLGQRMGAHGAETWAPPGGHLEFGEALEDCAIREVLEETALTIDAISKLGVTNDVFEKEQKHYITVFMLAKCDEGEPQVMEPEKCRQWSWFALDNLPHPLFLPLDNFLKEYPQILPV